MPWTNIVAETNKSAAEETNEKEALFAFLHAVAHKYSPFGLFFSVCSATGETAAKEKKEKAIQYSY